MVVIYSSAASEYLIEQPADLDNQARQSQDLREGIKYPNLILLICNLQT